MKAVLLAVALGLSCYATTSTPPGPNCVADPGNPACLPPLTDKMRPDGGAK